MLLPCNVTVSVEAGRTVVRAMNPEAGMAMLDRPGVADIAADVATRLRQVLDAVG